MSTYGLYTHADMYCTFIHTCTHMYAYACICVKHTNIYTHVPQIGTQRICFRAFLNKNIGCISHVMTAFYLLSLIVTKETGTFSTKLILFQMSGGNEVIYMIKPMKSPCGCCLRYKHEE